MTPNLATCIARAVESLELGENGLRAPLLVPGAFAELVRTFDIERFERDAASSFRLSPGRTDGYLSDALMYQGDTSYHAWVEQDAGELASRTRDPSAWSRTATLPLPRWAIEVQQALLDRVHDRRAFGWSAEMFYSVQPDACMGVHADNDDVFTIQLWGEKQWEIDPVDLPGLAALIESGRLQRGGPQDSWHAPPGAAPALVAPLRFTLRAGDFLATPAFALHCVRARSVGEDSRSVSCNVSICREEAWQRYLATGVA